MKKNNWKFQTTIAVLLFTFVGCAIITTRSEHYEEVPSMLNLLTNKAQIAVEEDIFNSGGEQAVFEYIIKNNPNVLNWFAENKYELKIRTVADTAVILVCDEGKPIFEDTYCNAGAPDRDYRNTTLMTCEITMSEAEINEICK